MFTITINVDDISKPVLNHITKFLEELAECRKKENKNFTASEIAESKKISKKTEVETQDIVPSPSEAFANMDNAYKGDNGSMLVTPLSTVAGLDNAYKDIPIFDVRGIAWDSRIHSSSRAIIADGTWKLRRGVDSELVKKVEFEQDFLAKKKEVEQPATVNSNLISTVDINPQATSIELFTQLMSKITTLVHTGQLPRMKAIELAQARGVTDLPSLASMPELTKIIMVDIDNWVATNAR